MNLPALGIDIAKDKFDVALLLEGKSKHKIFSNTREAVAEWLYEQGHIVSIVNPACIKAFGQSRLSRNKNDIGDCQLIAQLAQQNQPPAWSPSPPEVQQLQALIRQPIVSAKSTSD